MQGIKKAFLGIIAALAMILFMVSPSLAVSTVVYITQLPEYTTTNNFKLSYSALANDTSSITAQFYAMKEGGVYAPFGGVLNGASGQVQVTSSQVSEQGKYFFKVEVTSSDGSASKETSVVFDSSGPSSVSGYSKEKVAPGFYRLKWTNPSDSDFSRVLIYRNDNPSFSADGAHKVGELGGAPGAEMTWDDVGLDTSKDYYYILRALDKAGNSSGLVGDQGTVLGETTVVTALPLSTEVVSVPGEAGDGEGEVLEASDEAEEAAPSAVEEAAKTVDAVSQRPLVKWGVGGLIAALAIYIFFASKRRSS